MMYDTLNLEHMTLSEKYNAQNKEHTTLLEKYNVEIDEHENTKNLNELLVKEIEETSSDKNVYKNAAKLCARFNDELTKENKNLLEQLQTIQAALIKRLNVEDTLQKIKVVLEKNVCN